MKHATLPTRLMDARLSRQRPSSGAHRVATSVRRGTSKVSLSAWTRPLHAAFTRRTSLGALATSVALVALLVSLSMPALAAGQPDRFTAALAKGPLYAALAAFFGGVLSSLTPCVYPMIVITVSVFGAKQAKSKRQAMLLSTIFVLGIIALMTPLGVAAGMTGSLFGAALSNRWVVVGLAVVFLVIATSFFGVFEFVIPSGLNNKLNTMGGVGYGGAFVLGAISGIVAAPCTGPVLTGILLWIGKTQNPWLGAGVMASYSLGLGVLFWLVGTFAVQLPKSGKWMMYVKSFFGVVMITVALYFLKNAFPSMTRIVPPTTTVPIVASVLAATGLIMGAIHLSFGESTAKTVRKGLGIILSVVGLLVLVTWLEMPKVTPTVSTNVKAPAKLVWHHEDEAGRQLAAKQHRPVLIDFTAQWCGACKEFSRVTLTDPNVKQALAGFVLIKIDATNDEDPKVIAVQKRYKVAGLPTIILLDSSGKEVKRFTEFVPPSRFLPAVKSIKKANHSPIK